MVLPLLSLTGILAAHLFQRSLVDRRVCVACGQFEHAHLLFPAHLAAGYADERAGRGEATRVHGTDFHEGCKECPGRGCDGHPWHHDVFRYYGADPLDLARLDCGLPTTEDT
jgi:hypothetical protein